MCIRDSNDGLHVNPSFIYAVFLWPYFLELEKKYSDRNTSNIEEVFNKTLKTQSEYIAIPDFFQQTIFTIWSLQSSFLNLNRRNIQYLTNFSKFRAAYDFLLVREMAAGYKNGLGKWRTDFQKNDDSLRGTIFEKMIEKTYEESSKIFGF